MQGRLNNVSLVRLIAILFIFGHHIICGFFGNASYGVLYFPSSFGVEIFLFISAFLYGNKDITNFRTFFKKRFLTIFLPYYIFLAMLLIVYLIYNPSLITFTEILNAVFCLYIFDGSFHSLRHFWFLPVIMLCYCLIPLLQKLFKEDTSLKTKNFIKTLLCLIVITEFILAYNSGTHLQFTCFILGYFMAKKVDYHKVSLVLTLPLFLVTALVYLAVRPSMDVIGTILSNGVGQICMLVMGISFTYALLNIFDFLNNKDTPKILVWSDKISYHFYIVHQVLLLKYLSVLWLTPYLAVNIIIAFVLSCVWAYIVYLIQKGITHLFKPKPQTT